jgi:hypothetical protein
MFSLFRYLLLWGQIPIECVWHNSLHRCIVCYPSSWRQVRTGSGNRCLLTDRGKDPGQLQYGYVYKHILKNLWLMLWTPLPCRFDFNKNNFLLKNLFLKKLKIVPQKYSSKIVTKTFFDEQIFFFNQNLKYFSMKIFSILWRKKKSNIGFLYRSYMYVSYVCNGILYWICIGFI